MRDAYVALKNGQTSRNKSVGLSFKENRRVLVSTNTLFFAAGGNEEADGLCGRIDVGRKGGIGLSEASLS